jgi:penicillin-binding protein 2
MGQIGAESFEIDNRGRPKRAVERAQAKPGRRVLLSLDSRLQVLATQLLAGRKGAVVAIEPSTGEVLCLVSSPTYDSKLFDGGIRAGDWNTLRTDETSPLTNRAIRSSYAPGSSFKIVTTLASLFAGQFSATRSVYCRGYFEVGNRKTKCMGHHGAISFDRAFRKSCNTYFIRIGYDAGIENLRKAALACGLGAKTGIDLPAEGKGIIPTEEWLAQFNPPAKWYPGDTVNVCIGQGMVGVTPLQMASLVSLVANNGVSYVPHVVRAFKDPLSESEPTIVKPKELVRVQAPPELWQGLKGGMVGVIQDGTAGSARIQGLTWGGKTGSSEHRKGAKTHSWFVGIAPIEQPKIVVAVLVEESGHGGEVAAPIARQLVERFLSKASTSPLMATNTARAAVASPSSAESLSNRSVASSAEARP